MRILLTKELQIHEAKLIDIQEEIDLLFGNFNTLILIT